MAFTDDRDTGVESIGSSSSFDSVLQGFAWGPQIREHETDTVQTTTEVTSAKTQLSGLQSQVVNLPSVLAFLN